VLWGSTVVGLKSPAADVDVYGARFAKAEGRAGADEGRDRGQGKNSEASHGELEVCVPGGWGLEVVSWNPGIGELGNEGDRAQT
jgi:hypothetical protein